MRDGQPSSGGSEVGDDIAEASEDDNPNPTPRLPFSKARCIALVVTLTGASFLNVSGKWYKEQNHEIFIRRRFSDLHLCR
jgi:hypothetical protein